jgi:hypothetical protein
MVAPYPHPHGVDPGEIGHGAQIDTGSTPGSTGGKFIGFGEEGTSAIANRAAWALSENCDWLYARMIAEMATPQIAAWTVPGGGLSAYTFALTVDVYCGSVGYSGQEGIDRLFTILDSNYNQLTDSTNGSKVVVKSVRDGDGDDVLGTGFVTNPVLTFKTVNPVTGVEVSASYTIPSGSYKIIYGIKGGLSDVTPDLISLLAIRTAEELPAGVVFQDGSRPMFGDLNLNSNSLNNVRNVLGATGVNTQLQGATAAESLRVVNWANIYLSDPRGNAYLSNAGESLDRGSVHTSILGSMANAWQLGTSIHGNRFRSKTGTITFAPTTGIITYPELDVILNGDRRTITAGSTTAVVGTRVLALDSSGAIQHRVPASLLTTDIPVAYYSWGGVSFTDSLDIRWTLSAKTAGLEVVVGNDGLGNLLPGADFKDLESAVGLVNALNSSTGTGRVATIIVRGDSDIANPITVSVPARIIGDGIVYLRAKHSTSVATITGSTYPLEVRNISFAWESSSQGLVGNGCFHNLGPGSVVANCSFVRSGMSGKGWSDIFTWNVAGRGDRVLIEDCTADVSQHFVCGAGTSSTLVTMGLLTNSIIRNCHCSNNSAYGGTYWPIDACGEGNTVEFCKVDGGVGAGYNNGIRVGDRGQAIKNFVYGDGVGSAYSFRTDETWSSAGGLFQNNTSTNSSNGFIVENPSSASVGHLFSVMWNGNVVRDAVAVAFNVAPHVSKTLEGSSFKFYGNTIGELPEDTCYGFFFQDARFALVQGNMLNFNSGRAVVVNSNTYAHILDNTIRGFAHQAVWLTSTSSTGSLVKGNYIDTEIGGDTYVAVQVEADHCKVLDNHMSVVGGGECGTGISLSGDYCVAKDNFLRGFGGSTGSGFGVYVANCQGCKIESNQFIGLREACLNISVLDSPCTQIWNNYFFADGNKNAGIYLTDTGLSCSNISIRGNTFHDIYGYPGAGLDNYIIWLDNASTSIGVEISGNRFYKCGDTTDKKYCTVLIGNGGDSSGVVSDNVFTNTYGAAVTGGYYTTCIKVDADQWVVEGNQFYQATTLLGGVTYMIYATTRSTFLNNVAVVNGSQTLNYAFRFIYAPNINDMMVVGNHFWHYPGVLTGTGFDLFWAIDLGMTGGMYCMVSQNRVQKYGIRCQGDYCVVTGNQATREGITAEGLYSVVQGNSSPDETYGYIAVDAALSHPTNSTTYDLVVMEPHRDQNYFYYDPGPG